MTTEAALLLTAESSDPTDGTSSDLAVGAEAEASKKEKTYVDASKKSTGVNPLLVGLLVVVLVAAGGYIFWLILVKKKKEKEQEPEGPAPVVMNGYLQKPTVGVAAARAIRPIRSNVASSGSSSAPKNASTENAPEKGTAADPKVNEAVVAAASEADADDTIPEMERTQQELQKRMEELEKEMEALPDLDSAFPKEGPKE